MDRARRVALGLEGRLRHGDGGREQPELLRQGVIFPIVMQELWKIYNVSKLIFSTEMNRDCWGSPAPIHVDSRVQALNMFVLNLVIWSVAR